jgi:ATP-dependent Clp protease ATP-binding subunit ClpB
MRNIVDIQVSILKERLKDRKIEIELTPKAADFIADKGYSPEYGARPLKRTIQRLIVDPLSVKIIKGELKEKDKVIVDIDNREIIFRKA